MASRILTWRSLLRLAPAQRELVWRHARPFSVHAPARTDGVFRALTESRVAVPWIEAFRKKQKEEATSGAASSQPVAPVERDLTPRRMSDTYHSVILPLAQDPWLLDTYLNATGHLRLGTIFMDMDALSGVVAYKHTGDGVTTVTAACDRITIMRPLTEICDLEYSGRVTYAAGGSSMEITQQVAKAPKPGAKVKPEDVFLEVQFVMVSLDPSTKKPVHIPALQLDTSEERRLYNQGEQNNKRRKELSKRSLLRETPNDEESDLIHAIWQRQLQYHDPHDPIRQPDNVVFMDQTRLSTASIMQPQYRNRHQHMIFGGFLIKQTFELAFCCAASFAHSRPTFVSLDPSTFQNPVPVGSVLYLTATVVYTDPPLVEGSSDKPSSTDGGKTRVQVRVDSKVRTVEHGEAKPTGQFNYTFTVDKEIKVMPRSYTEYMMYVDARRRAARVEESMKMMATDATDASESVTE